MAKFKRYEGFANSIPQKMIDENLPVCPFCHSNQPHWLLGNKLDMMGGRTLYRCEKCEATMSGRAIDAAASGGKQFAFNAGYAAMNAAEKGRKGQEVGVSYFRIEELGRVCQDTALLNQELPLPQLQTMAGIGATTQQPVQQPVQQQTVQQPVYQQPIQQPVPVAPAAEQKPSLVMPILCSTFAILAWVLGYLLGGRLGMVWGVTFVLRIFLIIPSLIFGIIGLIKSLKGKKSIVGIILSVLGILICLYLIYSMITFIGFIARSGYYY